MFIMVMCVLFMGVECEYMVKLFVMVVMEFILNVFVLKYFVVVCVYDGGDSGMIIICMLE